jgi:hypothetical protein
MGGNVQQKNLENVWRRATKGGRSRHMTIVHMQNKTKAVFSVHTRTRIHTAALAPKPRRLFCCRLTFAWRRRCSGRYLAYVSTSANERECSVKHWRSGDTKRMAAAPSHANYRSCWLCALHVSDSDVSVIKMRAGAHNTRGSVCGQ